MCYFRVNSTCGGGADFQERFSIFSEPAYKQQHNGTFNSTIIARSPQPEFRSKSARLGGGFENDHDSDLNSSIGKLSQEAFAKLQPRANSSPKPCENDNLSISQVSDVSFLERKITINVTMYSLFLFLSVGFNISLSVYLFISYIWNWKTENTIFNAFVVYNRCFYYLPDFVKFIYSEKATKFCGIFTLLLSYVVPVKSKVKISQNFVAFSEYMNFKTVQ